MLVQCKNCGQEYILHNLVEVGAGKARAYAILERYVVISSAFRCLRCGVSMFYASVNSLGHALNREQIARDLQGFFERWEREEQGAQLNTVTLERFHTEVIKIVERGVTLD